MNTFALPVPRTPFRVGYVVACLLVLTVVGRAGTPIGSADAAMPAETQPSAPNGVPAALRAALGWQEPDRENYRPYETGSAFAVKTEPAKWAAAPALADVWVAAAPDFKRDPMEHLFRRMARVEALILNVTDPEARGRLKKESAELAVIAQGMREARPARLQEWQARRISDSVRELNKQLGGWLADTPEERLAVFRGELAALQPPDRRKLAASYGGDEKFAALVAEAREYSRLVEALNSAQQNDGLKGEEKRQAVAKAMSALGFFQGYHYDDKDLNRLMQDPDMAEELRAGGGESSWSQISVPELLEWTDAAGAEALLREAYALPVQVEFSSAPRTLQLAKTLVLEGKITPKAMPWSLFEWPGDRAGFGEAKQLAALHDVLRSRFEQLDATKPQTDWRSQSALGRLAASLAALDRTEEASALLKMSGRKDPSFPYHGSVDRVFAGVVWDFLLKAQGADVNADGWSRLSSLAPQAGRGQELVDWAASQEKAAPAGSAPATTWRLRHGWSLVAAGDPDAALEILVPIFGGMPAAGDKDLVKEWAESAERLLKLAVALGKADLVGKIRADLLAGFKDPHGALWDNEGLFATFARQELATSQTATLEQLLRARLSAKPAVDPDRDMYGRNDFPAADYSAWLADVIGRQGHHEEVLKWLAESPHWSNRDLAQQIHQGGGEGPWRPLALVAAESLHATGHDAQAIAILEAYLPDRASEDPAYALYTSIRGPEALPFLEKLRTMDHYEERPLIWTASVLLAAGRVAEAETAVKKAIAIDPSDGGEPRGDRMRAYAVARDIALKKGDDKQAEFFDGVVKAIRMAEGADDLAEAGLISRAITQYEQALTVFQDAYCIQSRLAIRLAEENRMDEAIEHYKRAYELMPDSFGQVESHCFGCERAFEGERPQAVAEKVFAALIAKPPVKPQAFYLMGYLRMEQERWDEAAGYFTQAVEADPEYLNAWNKLGDVLAHTSRPRAERDRVAFRLFALDPYQRHGSSGLREVRDLPALWQVVAGVDRTSTQIPEKLYPLGNRADAPAPGRRSYYHPRETDLSPAGMLASHEVVQAVVRVLDELYENKQRSE